MSEFDRAMRDAERTLSKAVEGMAQADAARLEREQSVHREFYDVARQELAAASEELRQAREERAQDRREATAESRKRDRQHRRALTVAVAALIVSLVVGGWTIFGPSDTPEAPPPPALEQLPPAR